MRTRTCALASLCVVLLASPAVAAIGALDQVPAATLLLPYFEVDFAATGNEIKNTTFTIGNSSASAALAHVTLWTDLGVPTYAFDVYLTGYDVEIINLRLLFNGVLPVTADDGVDTNNFISPQGPRSQDLNFTPASGAVGPCGPTVYSRLTADQVTALQRAHTGQSSTLLGGSCGGVAHGDNVARGFVTIDSVYECSDYLPTSASYLAWFDFRNILYGEYWVIDPANNFEHGDALVAIEASTTDPLTDGVGDYTFYGRLPSVAGSGADHREPLPTMWVGRYLLGGAFDRGTRALVWRDTWVSTPFACGATPAPVPEHIIMAFDEQEQPAVMPVATTYFGRASQLVNLDDAAVIPIPFDFGFMYYNLNRESSVLPFGSSSQSHVTHVLGASGRFEVASTVWPLGTMRWPAGFWMEVIGECLDGVDNDGDLLIDYPFDPGCRSYWSSREDPACSDGIDNDGDLLIDYGPDPAVNDPQCMAPWDESEQY